MTGPDGAILKRAIVGESLLVAPGEVGSEKDQNKVFYFDLPLRIVLDSSQSRSLEKPR